MNNPARISSAVAFSVLSCSLAYTSVAETYYLNASEAGGNKSSWITAQNWSTVRADSVADAEAAGGSHPESSDFPSSEDGFIVPADSTGYTLRTSDVSDWNGKFLQLGGVGSDKSSHLAVIRHMRRGEGTYVWYKNDGLILGNKSRYMPYYSQDPYVVKGTVTVTADSEVYAARIQQRNIAHTISLDFPDIFKSEKNRYLTICSSTSAFSVAFSDVSQYFGSMLVTNENEQADVKVAFDSDFPGTLTISTNATFVPSAGIKVADLVVLDGAVIDACAGVFEITNSLTGTGKIRIVTQAFENVSPVPCSADLVRFPADSGITMDDLEFVTPDGEPLDCDGYEISQSGNAMVAVVASKMGYVTLTASDNTSRTKVNESSMTNALNWSDGLWPTNPLVDYAAIDRNLRTFDSGMDINDPQDDFVFKGNSLIMDEATLVALNRSFTCGNLVLRNGAVFAWTPYSHGFLAGRLTADEGAAIISVYSHKNLRIESEITGDGDVVLSNPSGVATESSRGVFTLAGDNSKFTGTFRVTTGYNMPTDPVKDYNRITPRFDRNFAIVNLRSGKNLGAPLAAVNPRAFTIENMARVQPDETVESLTIDEPTRGIFIRWVGRLSAAEGQTFTIASPLAVHGTLWKEGEGTLVLANPAPTFGEDAVSGDPDADATNRTFRVAGGDVKIASADAVNGLDVVFTNGAGNLVFDLGSGDETFRTYGIRNVKSSTPFAVEGDVEEIPVLLTMGEASALPVTCGLFTVAASMRDDALDCLSFEKSDDLAGVFVERKWRENEDGTWTLTATVRKVGTRIIVR